MPRPAKKAKAEACLVDESGKIPVTSVSRLVRLKVAGMDKAVEAQEILKKIHDAVKEEKVKGFVGATRFVCLEHFDFDFFLRFKDLDSFKAYAESEFAKEKIDPLLEQLKPLAVDGKVHLQAFVTDEW